MSQILAAANVLLPSVTDQTCGLELAVTVSTTTNHTLRNHFQEQCTESARVFPAFLLVDWFAVTHSGEVGPESSPGVKYYHPAFCPKRKNINSPLQNLRINAEYFLLEIKP